MPKNYIKESKNTDWDNTPIQENKVKNWSHYTTHPIFTDSNSLQDNKFIVIHVRNNNNITKITAGTYHRNYEY